MQKVKKEEPLECLAVPAGVIYTCDAIKLSKLLPSNSIHLIITDPAYQSLEKWRKIGTTTQLTKKWFKLFPNNKYYDLLIEFYRVLKEGSHLYIFCDDETRSIITTGYSPQEDMKHFTFSPLVKSGFKYWKSLVWDKAISGMGYHYRARHEYIIMAEKVNRSKQHKQLNSKHYADVLSFKKSTTGFKKEVFPTEKPIELIKVLIEQSSMKDELVYDPFCGSGVVGQACQKLNRQFILGDIDTKETISRLY